MAEGLNLLLINQTWLLDELRVLGFKISTAGFGDGRSFDFLIPDSGISIQELLSKLPEQPDRIIVFDDSSTLRIIGFERLEILSVFYSVDAHHHSRWHRYFSSLFDLTLVAQRQHIPEFESQSDNIKWFPPWPLNLPTPAIVREFKAVFRGSLSPELHPERAKFFSQLEEIVPVDAAQGDWADAYSRALIVVNQTVGRDLNFRNFEAIAGGALLVTPNLYNGFSELFAEGEEYVTYSDGDVVDAASKIKYFLAHPEEAIKIADRGREKLLLEHSGQSRAAQLAKMLVELEPRSKKSRNLSAMLSLLPTVLSHLFREHSPGWEIQSNECFDLLTAAIDDGEDLSEDFPSAGVFVVLLSLVENSRFADLEKVGRRLLEDARVDPVIIAVFVIYALMNQNKNEEAHRLARSYADNSEELIAAIPHLLTQVRERVIGAQT